MQDIHGAELPFIRAELRRTVNLHELGPTVLVVGSAVELEDRAVPLVPDAELRSQCAAIADMLVRHGMNLVSDACPGIPNLVEGEYVTRPGRGLAVDLSILRGPDETMTTRAYSPSGFPSIGDVLLFCASGFEVLSIINTHCVDLVLVIGGGLGSLMEGIIAVVNDLPVLCYSPAGGIAGEMQAIFERYLTRYKTLRITTCGTAEALDAALAAFAGEFLSAGPPSRLAAFLSRLGLDAEAAAPHTHTTITIAPDLRHVAYECGQRGIRVCDPVLLIDDARIVRDATSGAAIRSLLDSAPRIYRHDGVALRVPAGMPQRVWCPSIDTFLLISAVRRRAGRHIRRVLDVGTGSGVIALWLAERREALDVTGIDSQAEAARCAEVNAADSGLAARCHIRAVRYQDFWRDAGRFDLVVCNPPYLPAFSTRDDADGGESFCGLDLVIELLRSLDQVLAPGGECFLTLSSVSWTDAGVRGLMEALVESGRAEMIDEREVPFKLAAVLVDPVWLETLVRDGGVFTRAGDYAHAHRVQVWKIVSNRRASPARHHVEAGKD